MQACDGGHDLCAHALIMAGANVEHALDDGFNSLLYAAQNGHDLCVRALIEAKADVNHQNAQHVTALNEACNSEHEACALLLLHAGARADVKDDWGDTPLSIAQNKGMDKVLAKMQ